MFIENEQYFWNPRESIITIKDNYPDNAPSIVDVITANERQVMIDVMLDTLFKVEAKVLRLRFGIGCNAMTIVDVGKVLKLSRERVRQIEAKALRKLRRPERAEYLEQFIK